ncbi:MAG: biotin transporter BioY [Eubacteriales bacterium]
MSLKKHKSVLNLVYIALFAALIAVCSWITFPINLVPITLQTMAVCIAAGMLGCWRGICSVAVYLALGAVGLPVFAGFKGGIGSLTGATGGYLVGFLLTALIVGLAVDLFGRKWFVLAISMVLGIAVCYLFGTAWFMILMGSKYTLGAALGMCVIPFIIPDLCKIAIATVLCNRVYKIVKI